MLAFDLGSTKWTLGFTTAPAQCPRIRTMPAGDLDTLVKEIPLAKARFGLPLGAAVRSFTKQAGDGFWLHRWLLAHAVENVVVEASSIEVKPAGAPSEDRPARHEQVVALLLRWHGGERHVWSVVHVPSMEAEAHRRELTRARSDPSVSATIIPGADRRNLDGRWCPVLDPPAASAIDGTQHVADVSVSRISA